MKSRSPWLQTAAVRAPAFINNSPIRQYLLCNLIFKNRGLLGCHG